MNEITNADQQGQGTVEQPSNAALLSKMSEAVNALTEAQDKLVKNAGEITRHLSDPSAHGAATAEAISNAMPRPAMEGTSLAFVDANGNKLTDPVNLKGERGAPGEKGDPGEKGEKGDPGVDGADGANGEDGAPGQMPDHQWEGTALQFQKPDGTWGNPVELKGEKGDPGEKGEKGDPGPANGPKGDKPNHKWEGTSLSFENPDGSWGEATDLKGEKGEQGDTGEKGDQGERGEKGDTGEKGEKGEKGEPGNSGGLNTFTRCTCTGESSTKMVTVEGLPLIPGATLHVAFDEVNTAENIALALNGGETKPILHHGLAPEVGALAKNQIYTLMYDGTAWQILSGMASWGICQTVWFEDDLVRPGFIPMNGCIIPNFAATWPQAMAYLATTHGQKRCFASIEERQAAHVAIWHTLADGKEIGWEGVGGVSKFFYDEAEDKLYMPDLSGMFRAMAGDGTIAPMLGAQQRYR